MGSDECPQGGGQPELKEESWIGLGKKRSPSQPGYLQKYKLYETHSNFYMIGWDKSRTIWKVLKIDRLEPFELNLVEDPAIYSEGECFDLLQRIHDGNMATGGLKFVTVFYGIVGFVRFLGPYYMLLITKRRKVGRICGHAVYSISKSNMFPVPNSTVLSNMAYSKNENRYKKLIRSMDLTKDFYFSYSYNIMLSLQKSLCNHEVDLYETMFVWNEYLTRGIRNQLKNTTWTVALIFGFFKQVQLLVCEKRFVLTLIARRSRHYAGTRYLRRGVNEEGCVANDVETEQIVSEDGGEGRSAPISSVVQNRGSIPLFWSQETSLLSIKPDIRLSRKDQNYEATRLHFENLVQRYGNPVIIMNLVKTNEKKPRESILRSEFANAIEFLNKDLPESEHLKFLHWDLNKFSKNCSGVLDRIVDVASEALDLTGFFYCEKAPTTELMHWSYLDSKNWEWPKKEAEERVEQERRPLMFQNGVLRTNCIDCLDRTNVAQYAYGLVALGRQLYALGLTDISSVDIDSPLADKLMKVYEEMGDSLALQYGGSPAHKKIFAEKRGQWRAATRSQEFFRTLQRFYSNAYMDGEKQDSINVFLGHFQPMLSKPALWEAHSDRLGMTENSSLLENFIEHNSGFTPKSASGASSSWVAKWFGFMKRSLSDGNILSPVEESTAEQNQESDQQSCRKRLLGSAPEISACESDIDCSRSTPSGSCRKLYPLSEPDLERDHAIYSYERESFDYSNFLDFDWLSSSGNSVEDCFERSTLISALSADLASYASANQSSYASTSGLKGEERSISHLLEDVGVQQSAPKYSEKFINWVDSELLFLV